MMFWMEFYKENWSWNFGSISVVGLRCWRLLDVKALIAMLNVEQLSTWPCLEGLYIFAPKTAQHPERGILEVSGLGG